MRDMDASLPLLWATMPLVFRHRARYSARSAWAHFKVPADHLWVTGLFDYRPRVIYRWRKTRIGPIVRAYWFGPGRDLKCGAKGDARHGRLSSTPSGVCAAVFSSRARYSARSAWALFLSAGGSPLGYRAFRLPPAECACRSKSHLS